MMQRDEAEVFGRGTELAAMRALLSDGAFSREYGTYGTVDKQHWTHGC
jgi:hypothetical protein